MDRKAGAKNHRREWDIGGHNGRDKSRSGWGGWGIAGRSDGKRSGSRKDLGAGNIAGRNSSIRLRERRFGKQGRQQGKMAAVNHRIERILVRLMYFSINSRLAWRSN